MRKLALFPILLALSACSGHIRFTGLEVAPEPESRRPVAYVANPELKRELAILQASQLYRISLDQAAPDRITLQPLKTYGGCGNALLGVMVTLGTVPVHMPARYGFSYTVEGLDGKQTISRVLDMDYTVSIWETFRIFSNDDEELGRALRTAASRPDTTQRPAAVPVATGYNPDTR